MVAVNWISKNGVGIIFIENEDITHVTVGGNRKSAWEVRTNKALKVLPYKGVSPHFIVFIAIFSGKG